MTFIDYAQSKGIILLKDDIEWLRNRLKYTPKRDLKPIMTRYVEIWTKTMLECQSAAKKQNAGRRMANLWILEQTK